MLEKGNDYKYNLGGGLLGGALAQYAGLMSEGEVDNYQVTNLNGLGIDNFLEFRGNEFLGF